MTPSVSHRELRFHKSSYSSSHGQNCVEVATLPTAAVVRDSQYPHAGNLTFPATEWRALIAAVATEELT